MSSIDRGTLSSKMVVESPVLREATKVALREQFRKLGLLTAPKIPAEENLLKLPQSQISFMNYFRRAKLNQSEFNLLVTYFDARGLFKTTYGIVGTLRKQIIARAEELGLNLEPELFTNSEIALVTRKLIPLGGIQFKAPLGSTLEESSSNADTHPETESSQLDTPGSSDQGVKLPGTSLARPAATAPTQSELADEEHVHHVRLLIQDVLDESLKTEKVTIIAKSKLSEKAFGVTMDEISSINATVCKLFDLEKSSINPNMLSYLPVTLENLRKFNFLTNVKISDDKELQSILTSRAEHRHFMLEGVGNAAMMTRSQRIDEVIQDQLIIDAITALLKLRASKRIAFMKGEFQLDRSLYI